MSKECTVSVIMLSYNRQKWIERAIQSILNQTYKDFEFIIVDNGSSDNSVAIIEKMQQNDERIRLKCIEKSSIGRGRNVGLDMANGKYIAFVDDDDVAEPKMLEVLVNNMEKEHADISLCGSYKVVSGERLVNCVFEETMSMEPAEAVVTLLKRKKYNAAMPTKMLKRELFDEIRFVENGKYDDITVVYKYFAKAKRIVAEGTPLYSFYRHESNNSAFTTNDKLLTPEQLEEYLAAFRERSEYLATEIPAIADYAKYSEWSYMISMVNKIESNHLEPCKKQLEKMKNELKCHYDEFFNSPYIELFEREFMKKYF